MKKFNILLIAFLAFALNTRADVLLVEDFDYTTGSTLLAANPQWFHYWPNHDNTMLITGEGLTFAGYTGSGVGKALLVEGDHTSDEPYHAFTQVTSGDVFAAFMLQPTEVIKNGYLLTFCDENVGNFNNCGRVQLDYDYFGEDIHPIIGARVYKKADAVYAEDKPLDETKTYLVLLRYHIVAGNNNDEVSLYLFETMPTALPATPLIGPLKDSQAPDIHPAHVGLHTWNGVYGDSGEILFDGLRVATTWYEALGVEPPTSIEETKSQELKAKSQKVIRNGQIVIIRDGKQYNVLGTAVD